MATIAEQLTSLANTKTAIKQAIVDKGVAVADDTPFSGYAAKIGEIQGGGGAPATKYGVPIGGLLGDVNTSGKMQFPTESFDFNGTGIVDIAAHVFAYKFVKNPSVQSAVFSSLTTISGDYGCQYMFNGCSNLTRAEFQNLTTISGEYCCQYMFYGCTKLVDTGLQNLTNISKNNCCQYMFYKCTSLTSTGLQNLTKVTESQSCRYMFGECTKLVDTGLQNLTTITGYYGCYYMFYKCTSLTNTGLQNLTASKGGYGCAAMFYECSKLENTELQNLTEINGTTECYQMFYNCIALKSAGLESLTTISGSSACQYMFYNCTGLTKEYFPMLTTVSTQNALGTSSSNGMFAGCKNLTELHFRADAQAVIESLSGYASKFGVTNATIYFDLIGTITVGGVVYARAEKQSVRVDGVKTFVAWKDTSDNVVYTSYENNAEPAVGTTVYSDAGTTQVGTVEGVA